MCRVGYRQLCPVSLVPAFPDIIPRQLQRLRRKHSGNVQQIIDLLMYRLIYFLVAVTDAHGEDAAEEIQVLVAVGVPNELVLCAGQHQRIFVVVEYCGEQILLVGKNDFVFGHKIHAWTSG